MAPSTSAPVSVMLTAPPVAATLLKLLDCVNVTSPVPAFTVVAPLTTAALFCVTAPEVFSVRLVALMAPSTSAPVSVMFTAPPVTATELKLLACVSVTSPAPAFTVVAPLTTAAPFCVTAPEVFSVRLVALMAPSTSALLSAMLTAPPVAATLLKLLACVRATLPAPAAMTVAPLTMAGPLCVTSSSVVVTVRLAAARPGPLAPMAPSTVAMSLLITTAPVPVELMGPVNLLPALFSVTLPAPAAMIVVPPTVSTPPWLTSPVAVAFKLPLTVVVPNLMVFPVVVPVMPAVAFKERTEVLELPLAVSIMPVEADRTSCPELPVPVPVQVTLTSLSNLMSWLACSVSVVSPVQFTSSFTTMSPELLGAVPAALVVIVTLPVPRAVCMESLLTW